MKIFRGIFFKNFLSNILILLISFVMLGMAYSSICYRYVVSSNRDDMYFNAKEIVHLIGAIDAEETISGLEFKMMLSGISAASGYQIMVCNTDGVVLSCSDLEMHCTHMGMQVGSGMMALLETKQEYNGISNLDGIYMEPRYVVGMCVPDRSTDAVDYYVFVSSDTTSMRGMWRQFSDIFLLVAFTVMILAFLVSVAATKRLTKPLSEMAAVAHQFAKGDFSARVGDVGQADEVSELADSFNLMAESLERSEKLRSEFIANISHELKTPMTTITGFADGILDGTIPPEKQQEYIKVISSETKRLSRLVRNMLDMSKLNAMDPTELAGKSFDISEVAAVTLLNFEQKINEKQLDVDVRIPEEALITRGDKDSITQVVYNLMDNAIKFADPGSVLQLELWKQGNKAYVSIQNTGETISQAELPLIFDRFHKTDRSRSMDKDGVGLGLYIVKTILDSHNEDIFVTSENRTTRFVFSLTLWQK